MATINEIINYFDTFAPIDTAMDFDNAGLLVVIWKLPFACSFFSKEYLLFYAFQWNLINRKRAL